MSKQSRAVALFQPDRDAVRIGKLYERARSSIVDSLKHAIEAGTRLIAKKETMKHGEWLPWLEANAEVLRFDSRFTAAKLMTAARKCAAGGTFDQAEALKIIRQIWGHSVKPFREDDEWYTPQPYIEAARTVLGAIDLDPASNNSAQSKVCAKKWHGSADDGLVKPWTGRVWLNPPYSKDLLAQFIDKLISEYQTGKVTAAILLVNNFTDSDWFQRAIGACSGVCFPRDRIYFEHANGKIDRPLNGQVFFYFGKDVDAFRSTFAPIGAGFISSGGWSWQQSTQPALAAE